MLLMDIFNCGSYDIYNFDEILQDIFITDYMPIPYSVVESEE